MADSNSPKTLPFQHLRHRGPLLGLAAVFLALVLISAGPRIDRTTPTFSPVVEGDEPLLTEYLDRDLEPVLVDVTRHEAERQRLADEIRRLYAERGHRLAWLRDEPIQSRARALVETLDRAEELGLERDHYRVDELARSVKRLELDRFPKPKELMQVEVALSASLLLFTRDLREGLVDTIELPEWYKERQPVDVVALVAEALEEELDLAGRLAPEREDYRRLAARAGEYRTHVDRGGWPRVPDGETLEPGDEIPVDRFEPLVQRLAAEGDLGSGWVPVDRTYDATLVTAVRSFQQRHGLSDDGKVGSDTLAAMNVSAAQRLRQIEANLERWRWLPAEPPADRIEVNVPAFELRGYREGREQIRMRVVVGKPDWATPIFEDELLYAEIHPYWNVPESIAADEILPKLRENPAYLQEENMEVVAGWKADGEPIEASEIDWNDPGLYGAEYRIRQRPGASNSLGRIKFIFPNEHGVYLHDTPAQSAFRLDRRAESHGCVRVSEPLALADFLFAGDMETIRTELARGQQRRIDLDEPMPVILHYWTAFVGENGRMNFREDLYGLDEVLGEKLAERRAFPPRSTEPAIESRLADSSYQRARKPRVST